MLLGSSAKFGKAREIGGITTQQGTKTAQQAQYGGIVQEKVKPNQVINHKAKRLPPGPSCLKDD